MAEELNQEVPEAPVTPGSGDVTENDKLWAMLSWIPWFGWILALVAIFMEPQKDRPFIRYHAIQSLIANAVLAVISIVLGFTVILACIAPFLWLVLIYPAAMAYQGEWLEIPVLTDFCKEQGWIQA